MQLETAVLEKDAYGFYDKYESIAEAPLEFADKIYIESELQHGRIPDVIRNGPEEVA